MRDFEALEIAQGIAAMSLTGAWPPAKLRAYAQALEHSNLPAKHVQRTLERLLQSEDPERIFAGKLISEAKKHPLDTWLPQLPAPTADSAAPVPWRDPPAGYAAQFPLERPNPTFRAAYREQMARMRAEAAAYRRERRSEGLMSETRAVLLRLAAKWVAHGHRCGFCRTALSVPMLEEFVDWCLTAPPEETEPRAFCNACAPRAIEHLDGRLRAH